MIPLSNETISRLGVLFAPLDLAAATSLLENECGLNLPLWIDKTPEGLERIRYAVLKLSGGSMTALKRALAVAKEDWRDVLVAAGFGHDPMAHERWYPSVRDRRTD